MSTNLDKSLDDIIKAKPRKTATKKKASGAGVRKATTGATKAQPKKKAPASKAATKKAPGLTNLDEVAILADRVILSNIPLDIDEKSIKVGTEYVGRGCCAYHCCSYGCCCYCFHLRCCGFISYLIY